MFNIVSNEGFYIYLKVVSFDVLQGFFNIEMICGGSVMEVSKDVFFFMIWYYEIGGVSVVSFGCILI